MTGLRNLSVTDRIELAQLLWDSVAQDSETVPVPEFHRQELRRRLEDYRRDPTAGSSWPEVKSRIRARK